MTPEQKILYETLKRIGPTTDMDLSYTLREEGQDWSGSSLRHRRVRLMNRGLITKTKQVVNKPGVRPLAVWKAK